MAGKCIRHVMEFELKKLIDYFAGFRKILSINVLSGLMQQFHLNEGVCFCLTYDTYLNPLYQLQKKIVRCISSSNFMPHLNLFSIH